MVRHFNSSRFHNISPVAILSVEGHEDSPAALAAANRAGPGGGAQDPGGLPFQCHLFPEKVHQGAEPPGRV